MSEKQAQKLDVKAYSQQSPYLAKCCLLLSANESYARAAQDLQVLTGMTVSHSSQQRLVHRQRFDLPQVAQAVEEMSVDGGKVRLQTALLHERGVASGRGMVNFSYHTKTCHETSIPHPQLV